MANVIKGAGGGRRSEPVANNEVAERALAVVEEAEIIAAQILDDAREQVQELARDSAAQGRQEGEQQAEHLRQEISEMEQRMLKEVEGEIVRTALRVASELIEAEMAEREDAVVDMVCTALKETARNARDVFLRVNPADSAVLRDNKSRLIDALGRARDVDVREDRNVPVGGVLIQTESGVVDAQLETQLDEIAKVLGA
jgi:flagellar biosynthesis/type III secretory pathway protein FliH